MAYNYNEEAYYGDMDPMYKPSKYHGPHGGGSGGGGGSEITEIDFSKVTVKNAPWIRRKTLQNVLADLTGDPKTLNQTIGLLEEFIEKMKECATVSAASVAAEPVVLMSTNNQQQTRGKAQ